MRRHWQEQKAEQRKPLPRETDSRKKKKVLGKLKKYKGQGFVIMSKTADAPGGGDDASLANTALAAAAPDAGKQ